MAAPVAARNAGFNAADDVEGARTLVGSVKSDLTFCAILGVWDEPPDSMICHLVSRCKISVEV
jgi:hypothetical protein